MVGWLVRLVAYAPENGFRQTKMEVGSPSFANGQRTHGYGAAASCDRVVAKDAKRIAEQNDRRVEQIGSSY